MFKNLNPTYIGISGHQSEIIELALSNGFSGIDFNIADFATRVRLKGLPYAKRLIDSAKIRLGTFQLPLDVDADDNTFQNDLKKLSEYADDAMAVGCKRCFVNIAPAGDKRPYHENFEFYRRRFQEIGNVLKSTDVRLGLNFQAAEYLRRNQAFQFIHDLDATLQLVGMIDSPNVGLVLDVWEVFAAGGSMDAIRKIPANQIVSVQVAELAAEASLPDLDDKSRLVPDAPNGLINVPSVLSYLSEIGYDGPVTVKASRTAFPNRRRDNVVKLTSESLNKLWQAANLSESSSPVAAPIES